VLGVVIAAPVEFIEFELDVELAGDSFQYAQALGHDFLANAVTGNNSDTERFHLPISSEWVWGTVVLPVVATKTKGSRMGCPRYL
jgi:hypothetical protein